MKLVTIDWDPGAERFVSEGTHRGLLDTEPAIQDPENPEPLGRARGTGGQSVTARWSFEGTVKRPSARISLPRPARPASS